MTKKENSRIKFILFILKVDEEEEKALEAFMTSQPRRLLGDIIAQKQAENQTSCNYFIVKSNLIVFLADNDLDPRISSMYEQVGEILAHYRSGKIPKAFKILPNLANWEQVNKIVFK
jgi:essential nuclear protein 1